MNGQTIKTKIVTAELEKQIGVEQIVKIDTHGDFRTFPVIIYKMLKAFYFCENVIIFPAHNGVRVFVSLCSLFNIFFHRNLHYVVIGGWLNDFLKKRYILLKISKNVKEVYVETQSMKQALNQRGLTNVLVMLNFKDI